MATSAEKRTTISASRKKQLPDREDNAQNLIRTHMFDKEFKGYSKVLHGLFKGLILTPDLSESDEEEVENHRAHALSDSQQLFTETDVTLPSYLNGSLGSRETDRERDGARHLSYFCSSSTSGAVKILQEMETVYEQLKTERQKQLQWEEELEQREMRLKQQEEGLQKLLGLEEMCHSKMLSAEEKQKKEILHLQNLLREKTKENKRLKSSFESLKDLNDNMKKRLNELSEQNKRLEKQSKRVQARLENLQRKYQHGVALRECQKINDPLERVKPLEKDKTSGKNISKVFPSAKLLSLLLDWVLDEHLNSSMVPSVKDVGHCLPAEILLNERCLKVLPLLADQLAHTPLSEPVLVCSLLHLIHRALRHLDNSGQHVVLSATLRRIGEEVSKPRSHVQSQDPETEELNGPCSRQALYRSPCPETRILSVLIILRTVTQADVLAQVLHSMHSDLFHEECRGLLLQNGGVSELLTVLRTGRAGLQAPIIDILLQLTQESSYYKSFIEACSCDGFFHTISQVLRSPHLELLLLEKLCILLQKLSTIRRNRRLFESSSVLEQIRELQRRYGPTHTFLCLNLTSILHNLQ
ncbi:coiled-coil domain-containing protein 138 isoform X1 [Boleophthalmus pectinirostris]|uniref:coiled-coil domain-containing protein 138 isoform X1 n=1 Tax=Boleophthalmus pectinirostris TaxID=150288 RepID=UPI000A1C2107|nr:coiled-coil domain-containing protein 138 isoform X1 [Boleophthalmus pectinirostris]